jgi:phosphoribosylformimino-5-aminoimidazole carboxamide ribotide isomerase
VSGLALYTAIDILEGKAVRLTQGDFERRNVYADDPLEAAERWVADGARALHVVDLSGAREGRPVSVEQLRRICTRVSIPVQYGGGLRSLVHLSQALDAGATRVVLGTAAFTVDGLLERAVEQWPEQVAVAVDVRGGFVSISGWTEQSGAGADEAVASLRERGARAFIYTNVDRDGMLTGPDPAEVARVSERVGDLQFLYSGGIGSLEDLRALTTLRLPNLAGVIVGKALYEGRFTLSEAQQALEGEEVAKSS